jgi:hypothetical protein
MIHKRRVKITRNNYCTQGQGVIKHEIALVGFLRSLKSNCIYDKSTSLNRHCNTNFVDLLLNLAVSGPYTKRDLLPLIIASIYAGFQENK